MSLTGTTSKKTNCLHCGAVRGCKTEPVRVLTAGGAFACDETWAMVAGKTWIRDTRVRVRAAPTRAIELAALKQQILKAPRPTLSRRSGAREDEG